MNLTYEIVLNLKSFYTQRKPNKVNKLGEGGFGLWIKILIFNLFLSIYILIFFPSIDHPFINFLAYPIMKATLIVVNRIVDDILMRSWWMLNWSHVNWCLLELRLELFYLKLLSLDWGLLITYDSG